MTMIRHKGAQRALNDINEPSNVTMGVLNFINISRLHNRVPSKSFYFDSWHNHVAAKVDERKGKRVPFSIITGHHNGEGEDVGAV